MKTPEHLEAKRLMQFAEEYLLPVLRYTADKKGYIFVQESMHYTGMDMQDFDEWAKARSRLAVEKWEEFCKLTEGDTTLAFPA